MKPQFEFLFIPVALFLAACDPAYRTRRDSDHLNYVVPIDCLVSSIKNTPTAKILSASVLSPQYVCKEDQSSRQLLYSVDEETITLTGCYEGDVLKTFSQYAGGWIGGQKSKNVSALLRRMQEVELTIERRCNAKGFTSSIKSNCLRIDCSD